MSGTAYPIIAVGDPWHDAAFAVHDGRSVRHVEIERFTRHKYEQVNPLLYGWLAEPDLFRSASTFLFEEGRFLAPLTRALLSGGDVDLASQAHALIDDQSGSLMISGDNLRRLADELTAFFAAIAERRVAVEIYDHHFAHAADAFLSSAYAKALVITLDGGGRHWAKGKSLPVHGSAYWMDRSGPLNRKFETLVVDWSPGWAWVRAAKLLGYTGNDAGTVMAMAAFGQPNPEMERAIRRRHFWNIEWGALPRWRRFLEGRVVNKLASLVSTEEDTFALARELQAETERRVRNFMEPLLDGHEEVDLCLAGGTFLNCIIAGKIRSWFPNVRSVHIPPVPYDAGLCLGMLRTFVHDKGVANGQPAIPRAISPFAMGRTYSPVEVIAAGRSQGCGEPLRQTAPDLATDLEAGKVIALFQGSSESGRRALGNRSIVCDPRDANQKERLNRVIKKRQWFRPFAPMILVEHVRDWFEVDESFASPYMSFAAKFRDGQGERVPAVRHADGSARVQTVHKELTPRTHDILSAWQARTGIPILLNTSFNDSEPIVETPAEAIATMLRSGIDQVHFADHGLTFVNPAPRA